MMPENRRSKTMSEKVKAAGGKRVECDHILGVIDNERGYDFIKKETRLSWKIYELFDFCPKCGFKLSNASDQSERGTKR